MVALADLRDWIGLLEREGEIVWEEGCLSVPELTAPVKRARRVLVRGWTPEQRPLEIEAEELLAVALQHRELSAQWPRRSPALEVIPYPTPMGAAIAAQSNCRSVVASAQDVMPGRLCCRFNGRSLSG